MSLIKAELISVYILERESFSIEFREKYITVNLTFMKFVFTQ